MPNLSPDKFNSEVMRLHNQGIESQEIALELDRPLGTIKTVIHNVKARESGESKFTDVFGIMNQQVRKKKPESCCKEYDSTPVKGIYHNPKCKNWVMVD